MTPSDNDSSKSGFCLPELHAVTHDGHENINGPDALFRLGNRDAEIQELRQLFGVRMDTRGKVEYADAVKKI